jgi:hypothetical protein
MHSREPQSIIVRCALVLLAVSACSKGEFGGEVTNPDTAPAEPRGSGTTPAGAHAKAPAPRHENVVFTWKSGNESLSGHMETTLPTGEKFKGEYHEITTTIPVGQLSDFYGAWYGGPWVGDRWNWGGDWPYYDSADAYITHYTGKVVARLKGDRGDEMRCRFTLVDREAGIQGGGSGECQISNGERVTAKFGAS